MPVGRFSDARVGSGLALPSLSSRLREPHADSSSTDANNPTFIADPARLIILLPAAPD
jgi:hypothetical protein